MKQYIKPEMKVKAIVQTAPITTEEEEEGTLIASAPDSWWPF